MKLDNTRIVYDDDEIRIIWHPGDTDFVLVTFGDLFLLANKHRFFADAPARKAKISCLGIMAKKSHWYPQQNMLAAGDSVLPLLKNYRSRVIYGGSMGGYAAIKFSALLGATEVISLCPQWSIDPAECGGQTSGWEEYYVDSMAGMGIRKADVAGAVFVFVDPFEKTDCFHVDRIGEACPALNIIKVPMVGHNVTSVFAGTRNLLHLIEACRARRISGLTKLSRQMTRHHSFRVEGLIETAMPRHPRMLLRIVAPDRPDNPNTLKLGADYLFRAYGWFIENGDHQGAINYIQRFRWGLGDPRSQLIAAALLSALQGSKCRMMTPQKTSLVYDAAQDKCVHKNSGPGVSHIYVQLHLMGNYVALFIELGGIRIDLWLDRDGFLVTGSSRPEAELPPRFEIVSFIDGWFSLARPGKFLSAQLEGELICKPGDAHEWEYFSVQSVMDAAEPSPSQSP